MTDQAPKPNETPLTDETLMKNQTLTTNQTLTANQTLMANETLVINHTLMANETSKANEAPKANEVLMTNDILAAEIFVYIKDEFNHSNDFDIATNIVKEGLIDSMGILTLVSFLEKRYCVEINFEDITPDNFKNVGAIAGFIKKLRG